MRGRNGNGSGPYYEILARGSETYIHATLPEAIAQLEHTIDSAAARGLARHLLIHAGAVAAGERAILFPGASGQGKSTLVAALCLAGFAYMSDELSVINMESLLLLPFLKAIGLKDGGWKVLTAAFDTPSPALKATPSDGVTVRYLPGPNPRSTPTPIRFVLMLDRQPGRSASFVPAPRAQALVELAKHSLNLPRHGRKGVEALARVVEGADCYTLTYGDLREAVTTVKNLVGLPEEAPLCLQAHS
ncbi:MAG: hypothetical protein ACYC1C_02890 [Chloroflexota bacterium]